MQKKLSPIPAVYLHIPFCRTICPFCSFTVRRDRAKMHEKYIKGMLVEIDRRAEMLKDKERQENEEKLSGHILLKSSRCIHFCFSCVKSNSGQSLALP